MFAIHTPQSVDLMAAVADARPDAAAPDHHFTISFDHEGDDVSKCRMVITSGDAVFTYVFNTRGSLVSSSYEDGQTREAKAAPDENGRETEAANQAVI